MEENSMARLGRSKRTASGVPRGGSLGAFLIFSLLAILYTWGKQLKGSIPGLNKFGLQELAAIVVSIGVIYLVSKHHAALQAYFKK